MEYIVDYESPLGLMRLSCDELGLTGAWFVERKYVPKAENAGSDNPECKGAEPDNTECKSAGLSNAEPDSEERENTESDNAKSDDTSMQILKNARRWLDIYFGGEEPDFKLPVHLEGTDFQVEVWNILLTIPYGKTMSYGEIAGILAKKRGISRMSSQAVGGAVGRNKLIIIVPCHRVVGAKGQLTGFSAGIERKEWLLKSEMGKFGELFSK